MDRPYRVLVLIADRAGCGFFRALLPVQYLTKLYSHEIDIHLSDQISLNHFLNPDGTPKVDLVVHQRQYMEDTYKFAQVMYEKKIPQIYEIDDDLHNVSPFNSAYHIFKNPEIFKVMDKYFKIMTAKTVSTKFLAGRYNAQYVLPNSIDFENWDKYPRKNNGEDIIIGWAGSSTHYADIKECADAVEAVVCKYPNVKLALGGWNMRIVEKVDEIRPGLIPRKCVLHPQKIKDLFGKYIEESPDSITYKGQSFETYQLLNLFVPPEQIKKEFPLMELDEFTLIRNRSSQIKAQYVEGTERYFFNKVPKEKIIEIPWVTNVEDTPKVIQSFDIGIAPLEDIIFNRSKSNLKFLEYSALKIPTIASNVGPYSETITHNENGILVKSKGAVFADWVKALTKLVENKEERLRLGSNAHEFVRKNYNMEINAKLWRNTWIEVIESFKEKNK